MTTHNHSSVPQVMNSVEGKENLVLKITKDIFQQELNLNYNEALAKHVQSELDKVKPKSKDLNEKIENLNKETDLKRNYLAHISQAKDCLRSSLVYKIETFGMHEDVNERIKIEVDDLRAKCDASYDARMTGYKEARKFRENYCEHFITFKKSEIEKNNLELGYKIICQEVQEQKKTNKLRKEIDQNLFHTNYVKLAKVVVSYRSGKILTKEEGSLKAKVDQVLNELKETQLLVEQQENKNKKNVQDNCATPKRQMETNIKQYTEIRCMENFESKLHELREKHRKPIQNQWKPIKKPHILKNLTKPLKSSPFSFVNNVSHFQQKRPLSPKPVSNENSSPFKVPKLTILQNCIVKKSNHGITGSSVEQDAQQSFSVNKQLLTKPQEIRQNDTTAKYPESNILKKPSQLKPTAFQDLQNSEIEISQSNSAIQIQSNAVGSVESSQENRRNENIQFKVDESILTITQNQNKESAASFMEEVHKPQADVIEQVSQFTGYRTLKETSQTESNIFQENSQQNISQCNDIVKQSQSGATQEVNNLSLTEDNKLNDQSSNVVSTQSSTFSQKCQQLNNILSEDPENVPKTAYVLEQKPINPSATSPFFKPKEKPATETVCADTTINSQLTNDIKENKPPSNRFSAFNPNPFEFNLTFNQANESSDFTGSLTNDNDYEEFVMSPIYDQENFDDQSRQLGLNGAEPSQTDQGTSMFNKFLLNPFL